MAKFKGIINAGKTFITKNSPEILVGLGIVGMVGTTVLAVKVTPKALRLMEDKKEVKNDELTKKEIIETTWKLYVPSLCVCVASIGCIIGGCTINKKRNIALAAAYKVAESTLVTYRDKVIETIGEKKEKEIRDAIEQDKINKTPDKHIIVTSRGTCLCKDSISGRYFRSDVDEIKKVINELNLQIINNFGYISLNELYNNLGLESVKDGDYIGWSTDTGLINIDFDACLSDNDEPCIVIDYINMPKPEPGAIR